jgi:hypothetical protein
MFSDRRLLGEALAIEEPSHVRYIKNFATLLESSGEQWERVVDKAPYFFLESIRINTIPNFKVMGGCGKEAFVDSLLTTY